MTKHRIEDDGTYTEKETNLNAVTSATNGSAVDTRFYTHLNFFIEVTGNTGAVTVNIEGSYDGTTWFNMDSKTYTAVNDTDMFAFNSYFPKVRTTTTTQSDSTVTTTIAGRS